LRGRKKEWKRTTWAGNMSMCGVHVQMS
jgi:hypothetical protein